MTMTIPILVKFSLFSIEIKRKGTSEIRNSRLNDPQLKAIIECLENNMENGVLYCHNNEDSVNAQLVIPSEERLNVLRYYQNDETVGHCGIGRTTSKTTSRYYWPGIRKDIGKHVKESKTCGALSNNVVTSGLK